MSEGIRQQLAEAIDEAVTNPDGVDPPGLADELLYVLGVSAEEWDNAQTIWLRPSGRPTLNTQPNVVYRLVRVKEAE